MQKEFLLVALLAVFSDVVVPRLTELATIPAEPTAAEPAEDETAEEDEGEAADEDEVERLREENRTLKELVGEKELALRRSED